VRAPFFFAAARDETTLAQLLDAQDAFERHHALVAAGIGRPRDPARRPLNALPAPGACGI